MSGADVFFGICGFLGLFGFLSLFGGLLFVLSWTLFSERDLTR